MRLDRVNKTTFTVQLIGFESGCMRIQAWSPIGDALMTQIRIVVKPVAITVTPQSHEACDRKLDGTTVGHRVHGVYHRHANLPRLLF
jgi:hypothetical protein